MANSSRQAVDPSVPGTKIEVKRRNFDPAFRWLTVSCGLLLLLAVAGIFVELLRGSLPSLEKFGARFLVSQAWNPVTGDFGALSSIYGTLVSTAIAMVVAVPLSLIIALFLVELAPPRVSSLVGGAIELLAAIPSIIYGMWGLFVFAPFMADYVQPFLERVSGGFILFSGAPMGIGMLTAGLILALMILPFITSVTRDVFLMVPAVVKESAYGLGSTTWEVTRKVTIPYGSQGILGACFLGLGRAIGETMAVTFVIGNRHEVSLSLFAAANTIASTLANEFTEASEELYLSSLIELGLVLFLLTFLIQLAAQYWLKRTRRKMGAGQ
ncbi:MAG: phosphate ABC transporter permease subunit PstC [Desulfuromonadales bacterium]|nr:phosphate ABC transporter permease subunit PstC [Desulfuromonadales bacterium]